jgi:hypothetical protein
MSARLLPLLALVGLGFAQVPASAQDAPTLTVRIRSIDSLIADGKYLATLAGAEEQARQIDGFIKAKIGPKGLDGIDPKRPIGLYGSLGANGLVDSTIVLLVPITDEKAFLDLLDRLDLRADRGKDGIYTVTPQNSPFAVYLRFANKYLYATIRDKDVIAKGKLPDPASLLPAGETGAASVTLRIDQIPNDIKQIALNQIDLKLADAQDEKLPNETELQRKLKVQMIKNLSQQVTSLIKDGQALTVKFDLNRTTNEMAVEVSLSGKSGSKLAASIADLGQSKSLFGGALGADSAMNGLLHLVLPEDVRKALDPVVDEMVQQTLQKERDDKKRALAEKLLNVLTPTFKQGELDTAFTLRGPGKDGRYGLVVGVKVKDGKAIDQTAREMVALLPEGDRNKIKLDAESAGDIKIHRADVQKDFDAKARELLGDNPMYMAIRADAWFFAFGEGGLEALKEALAAKPQAGPQVQFEMALKRFARALAQDNKDAEKFAEEAFAQGKDNDRIRFTLDGGKALQTRLSLKTPVLKFFSLMREKEKAAAPSQQR